LGGGGGGDGVPKGAAGGAGTVRIETPFVHAVYALATTTCWGTIIWGAGTIIITVGGAGWMPAFLRLTISR